MMDSAHARLEVKSEEGDTVQFKIEPINEGSRSGLGHLDLQGREEASQLRTHTTSVRDHEPLCGMNSARARLEVKHDEGDTIQVKGEPINEGSRSGVGDMDLQGRDEASRLRALATSVRDQDDLERDISRQVSEPRSYLEAENSCPFRQISYLRSKPMKETTKGLKKQSRKRSKPLVQAASGFLSIYRLILGNQ